MAMMDGPKRHSAPWVASAMAPFIVLLVFAFIAGIGTGVLTYNDMQFGLITGWVFGTGTTVAVFLYGTSQNSTHQANLLADASPAGGGPSVVERTIEKHTVVPGAATDRASRLAELRRHLDALNGRPDTPETAAERSRLAADIAALEQAVRSGG